MGIFPCRCGGGTAVEERGVDLVDEDGGRRLGLRLGVVEFPERDGCPSTRPRCRRAGGASTRSMRTGVTEQAAGEAAGLAKRRAVDSAISAPAVTAAAVRPRGEPGGAVPSRARLPVRPRARPPKAIDPSS